MAFAQPMGRLKAGLPTRGFPRHKPFITMRAPIRVESMMHQGVKRIKVILPYQHDYIEKVKQVPGRRWSQSKKC